MASHTSLTSHTLSIKLFSRVLIHTRLGKIPLTYSDKPRGKGGTNSSPQNLQETLDLVIARAKPTPRCHCWRGRRRCVCRGHQRQVALAPRLSHRVRQAHALQVPMGAVLARLVELAAAVAVVRPPLNPAITPGETPLVEGAEQALRTAGCRHLINLCLFFFSTFLEKSAPPTPPLEMCS